MNIIIFGVSNIGKTTIGSIMADILKIKFYDIDEEIKKAYKITNEQFVSIGTLELRDAKRCRTLNDLIKIEENKVIAVTPLSYASRIWHLFDDPNTICIELKDAVENIFDRLIFSDENDVIYTDDEYKNAHKDHYMREINDDIFWYGLVYKDIKNKFDLAGMNAHDAAVKIIKRYKLKNI